MLLLICRPLWLTAVNYILLLVLEIVLHFKETMLNVINDEPLAQCQIIVSGNDILCIHSHFISSNLDLQSTLFHYGCILL